MENTQNQTTEQSTEYKVRIPNPNETKKMLVEVLLPVEKDEKELFELKTKQLQAQLDALGKKATLIRVLWYINDGSKTKYDVEHALLTMTNALFYTILPISQEIKDDYLKKLIDAANKMVKGIKACKEQSLYAKKQNKVKEKPLAATFKDNFDDYDAL